MQNCDFRYMRQGKQLGEVDKDALTLIKPVNQYTDGSQRALLAIHGFASTPAVYRYLLPKLKHYDAIVCPSLPGHAESIASFAKTKASDWLDFVLNSCGKLINQYKEVDVLGLSLGGLLTYELTHHFPIHHAYLLAPALKLKMNVSRNLFFARILYGLGFRHLRNAGGNMCTPSHAEISYRTLPITAVIEMLEYAKNYQWKLPTCPVDLFLGRYDAVVDSNAIEAMFQKIPNTTTHWLEHSAHVLPLDNDMDEIIQCINRVC
jgi:carboxylesterase